MDLRLHKRQLNKKEKIMLCEDDMCIVSARPEKEKIETNKKKVYCKDCKYYSKVGGETCDAPNNWEDSYYAAYILRNKQPYEKNRYNDCEDYKPSLFKRFKDYVKDYIGSFTKRRNND